MNPVSRASWNAPYRSLWRLLKGLSATASLIAILITEVPVPSAEPLPAATNHPSIVSFLWPVNRLGAWPPNVFPFGYSTRVKLKVDATDSDGTVTEVRFYGGTTLLGTETNPPFNLVWSVPVGQWTIKAVAIDNLGAQTEATAGTIVGLTGRPPEAYVEIVWPPDGAMFAAPATFDFAAEVMAGGGDTGPIEFLIDNNVVGQDDGDGPFKATTPPSILTITNLAEGNYALGVSWLGSDQCYRCFAVLNHIRVVKLGVHSSRVRPDGVRQFEVATSYPGKAHVIEESADLLEWCYLATTIAPATNSFTFVVPGPAPPGPRYYRAMVPEQ
jgi:hypothetical protein